MTGFMIGCNFWDSKSGTDMWIHFDEDSLAKDLDALAATGIRYMRCFPNWRDFQPVITLRQWGGNLKEYRLTGDRYPENEYYIDPMMIERFRKFAFMANERNIKLVVSVLTGWMSGRQFYPQILESRNLITDPLALMFEEKFVRGFVTYTKDLPNIVMWDLGNECNCMGQVSKPEESYLWTCTIRNAILAADNSRKISSGMHSLNFDDIKPWSMNERELGLLDADRNPKPVGKELKRMADLLDTLPALSPKITDTVIVLSNDQEQQPIGFTSYILAKRAGLTPTFASYKYNIPEAPFYILPSIAGWAPINKECFDTLVERVKDGATLLVTVTSGMICEFEDTFGLRSSGMTKTGKGSYTVDGYELPYEYVIKYHLSSIGAKVIAAAEDGNVILSENKLGKGKVLLLSYPLEAMVWQRQGAYEQGEPAYHHIYEIAAKDVLEDKPMKCLNPDTALTLHKDGDGFYAVAVNYMNEKADAKVALTHGWTLEPVYGDFTAVESCGMAVAKLIKK